MKISPVMLAVGGIVAWMVLKNKASAATVDNTTPPLVDDTDPGAVIGIPSVGAGAVTIPATSTTTPGTTPGGNTTIDCPISQRTFDSYGNVICTTPPPASGSQLPTCPTGYHLAVQNGQYVCAQDTVQAPTNCPAGYTLVQTASGTMLCQQNAATNPSPGTTTQNCAWVPKAGFELNPENPLWHPGYRSNGTFWGKPIHIKGTGYGSMTCPNGYRYSSGGKDCVLKTNWQPGGNGGLNWSSDSVRDNWAPPTRPAGC